MLVELLMVDLVVCCVCSGYCCSDVDEGKDMRAGYRLLSSSDISLVMVTVGIQDCIRWLATP